MVQLRNKLTYSRESFIIGRREYLNFAWFITCEPRIYLHSCVYVTHAWFMLHVCGFRIHLNMSYGFSLHAEVGDCSNKIFLNSYLRISVILS